MVFNETAERGSPEETVLVNPVIIEKGRSTDVDTEGCLSFPKIYAEVEVGWVVPVLQQPLFIVIAWRSRVGIFYHLFLCRVSWVSWTST
jgi:hypothetical protein